MIEEIIYTSAPQGLKPGSKGFCTVASTAGMASTLVTLLESLSGYRHLVEPGTADAVRNPVVYSHFKARLGGRSSHILSRIADAGLDYSGRSNKIAHHVVLNQPRLNAAGPAAIQQFPGFHETTWSGEPRILSAGRTSPQIESGPGVCSYWQQIAGDAGWGGVCAEDFLKSDPAELWIIYPPGTDMLRLLCESLALLPPAARWNATYTTFYTKLPPHIDCRLRCALDGTPEAQHLRKRYELKVLDLCGSLGTAPESEWTRAARTGVLPSQRQSLQQLAAEDTLEPAVVADEATYEIDLAGVATSVPPPLPGDHRPAVRVVMRGTHYDHSSYGGERQAWLIAGIATVLLAACLLIVATMFGMIGGGIGPMVAWLKEQISSPVENQPTQSEEVDKTAAPAPTDMPQAAANSSNTDDVESSRTETKIVDNSRPPTTGLTHNDQQVSAPSDEKAQASPNTPDPLTHVRKNPSIDDGNSEETSNVDGEAVDPKLENVASVNDGKPARESSHSHARPSVFRGRTIFCLLPEVSLSPTSIRDVSSCNIRLASEDYKGIDVAIFSPPPPKGAGFLPFEIVVDGKTSAVIKTSAAQSVMRVRLSGNAMTVEWLTLGKTNKRIREYIASSILRINVSTGVDGSSDSCDVFFRLPQSVPPLEAPASDDEQLFNSPTPLVLAGLPEASFAESDVRIKIASSESEHFDTAPVEVVVRHRKDISLIWKCNQILSDNQLDFIWQLREKGSDLAVNVAKAVLADRDRFSELKKTIREGARNAPSGSLASWKEFLAEPKHRPKKILEADWSEAGTIVNNLSNHTEGLSKENLRALLDGARVDYRVYYVVYSAQKSERAEVLQASSRREDVESIPKFFAK